MDAAAFSAKRPGMSGEEPFIDAPKGDPTLFDELVDDLDVEGVEQAQRWELGRHHLAKIQRQHHADKVTPFTSRTPCPICHTTDAYIRKSGGQNVVRCRNCDRMLYNASKTETGERARTVKTLRQKIKPSQQARILDRDAGRCVLCGSTEELTIGHLLSLEDGCHLGATAHELNADANLAAMCEACNLGLPHGPSSVNPRTYAVIMWRLVQAEIRRGPQ